MILSRCNNTNNNHNGRLTLETEKVVPHMHQHAHAGIENYYRQYQEMDEPSAGSTTATPQDSDDSVVETDAKAPILIREPTERDVLCGRGRAPLKHPGNVKFFAAVRGNLKRYVAAPRRIDKSVVVASVVSLLQSSGARFLKRDKDSKCYFVITDDQARMKTGHAIRDLLRNGDSSSTKVSKSNDSSASSCEQKSPKQKNSSSQKRSSSPECLVLRESKSSAAVAARKKRNAKKRSLPKASATLSSSVLVLSKNTSNARDEAPDSSIPSSSVHSFPPLTQSSATFLPSGEGSVVMLSAGSRTQAESQAGWMLYSNLPHAGAGAQFLPPMLGSAGGRPDANMCPSMHTMNHYPLLVASNTIHNQEIAPHSHHQPAFRRISTGPGDIRVRHDNMATMNPACESSFNPKKEEGKEEGEIAAKKGTELGSRTETASLSMSKQQHNDLSNILEGLSYFSAVDDDDGADINSIFLDSNEDHATDTYTPESLASSADVLETNQGAQVPSSDKKNEFGQDFVGPIDKMYHHDLCLAPSIVEEDEDECTTTIHRKHLALGTSATWTERTPKSAPEVGLLSFSSAFSAWDFSVEEDSLMVGDDDAVLR